MANSMVDDHNVEAWKVNLLARGPLNSTDVELWGYLPGSQPFSFISLELSPYQQLRAYRWDNLDKVEVDS